MPSEPTSTATRNASASTQDNAASAAAELPPKLSDPLESEIPKPDGDPFNYFLKPMLEKDSIQCNAWKEEVQNILIFAGLFSAVVTAFIVESYQQLRPDSNDSIVGLLAHIAEKLDNPSINGTAYIPSIASDTNFAPSRSDIIVNVLWFISLVLSLTAALIGIVTLQWLREHQRYDNALKPRETMAILHMRLDSLKRWYVPQIFAGLPLLLQGALVLFFAGMIEFLFALRLEVAIPVTLSICVPLIFLIATTLLPILQVFILQDPFRLSINNNVISPCPYKSPQSLIFRRIGIQSRFVFKHCTTIVGGAYICFVQIRCYMRKLAERELPIFRGKRTNVKLRLHDEYPRSICKIRRASGDWTSIDRTWLRVRTIYAVSLQMTYRNDDELVTPRAGVYIETSLPPQVYDCTLCVRDITAQDLAHADQNALYHCAEILCSQATDGFQKFWSNIHWRAPDSELDHAGDLCFAFGRFLCYDQDYFIQPTSSHITATFIKDVMLHNISDGPQATIKPLRTAFMLCWLNSVKFPFNFTFAFNLEPTIQAVGNKVAGQLLMDRLEISPERVFMMGSGEMWLPRRILQVYAFDIDEEALNNSDGYSQSINRLFRTFLERCLTMQTNLQLVPFAYWGVFAYMRAVAGNQRRDTFADSLAHLTQLCKSYAPQILIHKKPFLMIAACFYLNAIVMCGPAGQRHVEPLIRVIHKACKIKNNGLRLSVTNGRIGWEGLDAAIYAIYKHHNPSRQSTSNPNNSTSPTNPNDHDNSV